MRFLTIREAARELKESGISETLIRRLVACGECPGVHSGTRFLVNLDGLMEQLEQSGRKGTLDE